MIRVRRGSDNQTIDIWFSDTGAPYRGLSIVEGSTELLFTSTYKIETWAGNNIPIYVVTWYDQSTMGINLSQMTNTLQPQLVYDHALISYSVRFSEIGNMTAINAFPSTTVNDMHLITKSKEISYTNSFGISYNGNTSSTTDRFSMHMPFSDRKWYWQPGNTLTDQSQSIINITNIGDVAEVSAYKSSSDQQNGLKVNNSALYTSSGFSSASSTGGWYSVVFLKEIIIMVRFSIL